MKDGKNAMELARDNGHDETADFFSSLEHTSNEQVS